MWRAKSEWIFVADALRVRVRGRTTVSRVGAGLVVIFGFVSACESVSRGDGTPKARGVTQSQPAAVDDTPGPPPVDAQKTASGLVTQVLRPGRGDRTPHAYDKVRVHFTSWNNKGKRVEEASALLRFMPQAAARDVARVRKRGSD